MWYTILVWCIFCLWVPLFRLCIIHSPPPTDMEIKIPLLFYYLFCVLLIIISSVANYVLD